MINVDVFEGSYNILSNIYRLAYDRHKYQGVLSQAYFSTNVHLGQNWVWVKLETVNVTHSS